MIPSRNEIAARLRRETGIIDCHTHVGVSFKMYLANEHPYCLGFEDLVIRMRMLGIERSVVFPRASSYYLPREHGRDSGELTIPISRFPYKIENENLLRELFEMFPEYSHMAIPFVYIDPSRCVAEQVAAIEALMERFPVCGLKVCTSYIHSYVADLDGKGAALLDLARRRRLPVLLHSSWDPADPWAQAADIVALARRHPDVRFCLAHTARFNHAVLEEADRLDNCFVDLSAFSIHCTLATRAHSRAIPPAPQRFPADYTDPAAALQRLVQAYPDTLIWGTDTPCYYWVASSVNAQGERVTTRLKCSFDAEAKLLRTLDEASVRRISRTNTLAFLLD